MSTPSSPLPDVRGEILRALDPNGEMQRLTEEVKRLPPLVRARKLRRLVQAPLETVVLYWVDLTDRGWGVANVGVDIIREAGALLDVMRAIEIAERNEVPVVECELGSGVRE
jgi:hypothetical protein